MLAGIKAFHEPDRDESHSVRKKKFSYLPMHPLLRKDGFLAKQLSEKADDFVQLTLEPAVVVLEPFSCIIHIVQFDLEDICTFVDPRRIDNEKPVAHVADELVLKLTCAGISIIRSCGCRVTGLSTFQPACCSRARVLVVFVVVIGNISEFATKGLIFLTE